MKRLESDRPADRLTSSAAVKAWPILGLVESKVSPTREVRRNEHPNQIPQEPNYTSAARMGKPRAQVRLLRLGADSRNPLCCWSAALAGDCTEGD